MNADFDAVDYLHCLADDALRYGDAHACTPSASKTVHAIADAYAALQQENQRLRELLDGAS